MTANEPRLGGPLRAEGERTAARRLLRRVGAPSRKEEDRQRKAERGERRGADEECVPAAEQEQEAAERRTEGGAEVRGDADGRVSGLVPVVWHKAGHEGLSSGVADLEEEPAEAEDEQAGRGAAPGRDETEDDHGLSDPAHEDQGPPADGIGKVARQAA